MGAVLRAAVEMCEKKAADKRILTRLVSQIIIAQETTTSAAPPSGQTATDQPR